MKYSVGVLVASDSCSMNLATDKSGVNLQHLLNNYSESKIYDASWYSIIPDNIQKIKEQLIDWSDNLKLNLILTTGGSGFSPTDVTPEATKEVIEKELSHITNGILIESLKITRFAMLSRAVAGIRKKTLIINLPGSKKGSQESLEIVLPVLKHALDLINDSKQDIKTDHSIIQGQHSHNHHHHHNNRQCHHNQTKSRVTDEEISNKPRKSNYPMISVDEAVSIVMKNSKLNDETEEVHYLDALGRITSTKIIANDPLPPFAASVKDGFAVKLSDKQKNYKNYSENVLFVFDVVGIANAGDETIKIDLKEGQCVKINTGAPVPLKADAVVQIEDTISLEKNENGQDTKIQVLGTSGCSGHSNSDQDINITLGQDIRPIGFDIQVGETVVREKTCIGPAQIGICATVGALNVKVIKNPYVALISTGNELRNPDQILSNGQIRDSNKSLLFAALKTIGLQNQNIYDAGIANDDPNNIMQAFKKAFENADVIISTGGVSMGDKDLVKDVLVKDFNCEIHFARLNMKPGKPTTFATCEYRGKKKLLFCLPGNPVSGIVTFNLIVLPCLKKLMGYENCFHTEIKVKCEFESELDPRPEYHRCFVSWSQQVNSKPETLEYPSAYSTGNQHSSRLLSMNQANCLVKLPGRTNSKASIRKGEILNALVIEKI